MQPNDLTIFYTYGLRGDLHRLPKLYTFMEQLKTKYHPKPLILDLGESCADDVWHCEITKGRSTLIVLDGMGYHAANVDGIIQQEEREKLTGIIRMGLVDNAHDWHYDMPPVKDDSIRVAYNLSDDYAIRLQIYPLPDEKTYVDDNVLYLTPVKSDQMGVIQLKLLDDPQIISNEIHTMPKGLHPNPTIVAAVEFVEDEARYYQKHKGNNND